MNVFTSIMFSSLDHKWSHKEFSAACTQFHNILRVVHNAVPLKWDQTVEEIAQSWANYLSTIQVSTNAIDCKIWIFFPFPRQRQKINGIFTNVTVIIFFALLCRLCPGLFETTLLFSINDTSQISLLCNKLKTRGNMIRRLKTSNHDKTELNNQHFEKRSNSL